MTTILIPIAFVAAIVVVIIFNLAAGYFEGKEIDRLPESMRDGAVLEKL